jgi:hypothetical protein
MAYRFPDEDNLKTPFDDALLKNKVQNQSGALTPTETKPLYKHQ